MLYPYVAGSQDAHLQRGLPLMRHLALVYPGDRRAASTDDQYLFGCDLLVARVSTRVLRFTGAVAPGTSRG